MPGWWLLTLGVLQAAALVLILLSPLSWPWIALLLLAWLAAGVHNLRLHAAGRLVRAVWGEEDGWRLWFADGRECSARLAPRHSRHGPLLQLRLRLEQGRDFPLLILPGMLPEETLRRLKVRLRLFSG
jgi:hypothetical protein